MDKDSVRATMLSLSESELKQAKQGYADFLKSALIDRSEPVESGDAALAATASDLAEAFDQPIHTSAEKVEKLNAIDFSAKTRVQEGAIVKLNGCYFVISVPTSRFVCDGESFMGISTDAPIYKQIEGLRRGDALTFGTRRFTVEQLY